MEITFTHPAYLWFLALIPFLIVSHFYGLKSNNQRAVKFANFAAIQRITGKKLQTKNYTLLGMRICILFFICFSVAGTIIWYQGTTTNVDYVLVIDTSGSMLAKDFAPDRLSVAKESATAFVDQVGKDVKIGIVTFAGTAFAEQDLSKDKNKIQAVITKIDINPSGGTDIGEALVTAANVLKASDRSKAIILLTDGQSNIGTNVDDAIIYVNQNVISVHTIGIGTQEGGSYEGVSLKTVINEEELKKISENTDGRFFLASNKEELDNVYKTISEERSQKISVYLQSPMLIIAIILLFIEWGLINTRFRILP